MPHAPPNPAHEEGEWMELSMELRIYLPRTRASSETISLIDWAAESRASLSANGGLYLRISSRVTLCQTGKMTFSPTICRAINPSSSYLGQFFAKKDGDNTTKP